MPNTSSHSLNMFNRLSLFVLASLAVFVTAQYPSCAQSCVGQASPGSCSLTDNACLCQNASYCNTTNDCFRTSCSYADWTSAYNYSVQLCNQAGVTESNTEHPPRKRAVTPAHVRTRMHKARL
ncbi:unnamed protein product [Rhizoctonia solani]|uniref:CFEM domain-containing protein n=1 Tax=Rhizoctonia solani TaxID=456999 RepID=A0A8H3HRV6_9AGAM|nr:unnamed protein product [Rhizoctonia solani]CAE6533808.1 unnamed protein product [Rhizoctonia solani]